MEDRLKLLQDIAERERNSRKEAERLLEEKATELYKKTKKISQASEELTALNTLLINVMASSPDGILTCSPDMLIQSANQTAEKQLGLKEKHIIGQDIETVVPHFKNHLGMLAEDILFIEDTEVVRADGTTFAAEIRGTCGGENDKTHFVLFLHDITRRLRARREKQKMALHLDEARRLEAIGALSAGIAHEINTPIQFIGDNLDFLKDAFYKIQHSYLHFASLTTDAQSQQQIRKHCDDLQSFNKSIRLPNLITDIKESLDESYEGIAQVRDIVLLMKEFAHPGTGNCKLADMNEIITGVIKITSSKHKDIAEVELDLADDLPSVSCRRGQIQQVILNMVLNSIDAIEDAKNRPAIIRIKTFSDAEAVHIQISDTGPGVPDNLAEKIFNPFFTTKPVGKGTGQGLALAKDFVVKGHGGLLKLINVEPFSTTFQISLPLKADYQIEREHSYAA